MPKTYDVAIIGGGPAGSHAGALLARQGYRVAIVEKETFPRFQIGESLLPASMPLLKESGFLEKLSSGRYLEKYGARFIDYGSDEEVYFGFANGINDEINMAYEVPRADFDLDLLRHAETSGAELFLNWNFSGFQESEEGVEITCNEGQLHSRFLIDASGRQAVVAKQLGLKKIGGDFNNLGVFAHFEGVSRAPGKSEGDIRIGLLRDQSWSWQIPFRGSVTSVGIVSRHNEIPKDADLGAYIIEKVGGTPKMRAYMEGAKQISEARFISNYGQESQKFWGRRWLSIGDAAKFLDPCFSSGVHNGFKSAKLATSAIDDALKNASDLESEARGARYEAEFRKGVNRFHRLIGIFYGGNFVHQMKRTLQMRELDRAFISAVSGDMWNDDNVLFQKGVL